MVDTKNKTVRPRPGSRLIRIKSFDFRFGSLLAIRNGPRVNLPNASVRCRHLSAPMRGACDKKKPASPARGDAGIGELRHALPYQYVYVMRRLKARPIGLAALLR